MPSVTQAKQKLFLDVAKAAKKDLEGWRRGVSIESRSGMPIDALVDQAALYRVRLAGEILKAAKAEAAKPKPNYRNVVGRSYYAMYHYVRALVYFIHRGDDHEAHSTVAREIPDDFVDKASWQNRFRDARLERNRADYDPFPLSDGSFKASAVRVLTHAVSLSTEVRSYLRAKGLGV